MWGDAKYIDDSAFFFLRRLVESTGALMEQMRACSDLLLMASDDKIEKRYENYIFESRISI